MDLLLDTHPLIWFLNGDSQLSLRLQSIIADTSNRCFLSIASLWEIAVKVSLGKLQLKGDFNRIADFLNANDIGLLPITFEHLQSLLLLPAHHKDLFDRIIIAQAVAGGLTVGTKDDAFDLYGVNTIWK